MPTMGDYDIMKSVNAELYRFHREVLDFIRSNQPVQIEAIRELLIRKGYKPPVKGLADAVNRLRRNGYLRRVRVKGYRVIKDLDP